MKRALLMLAAVFALSCQSGHEIKLFDQLAAQSIACPCPYPQTKIRFIHTIEVRSFHDVKTALIGVTLIDPASRIISCALMSAEGMAVFEASATPEGLEISRALPPLDSQNFARNMMDDIEMIFLPPRSTDVQKGILADGTRVCRYQSNDGWIDMAGDGGGKIEIKRYEKGRKLKRSVTLAGGASGHYDMIELAAPGTFGYRLTMTLIDSQGSGDDPFVPAENRGGD